jgi:hypothetical protein
LNLIAMYTNYGNGNSYIVYQSFLVSLFSEQHIAGMLKLKINLSYHHKL